MRSEQKRQSELMGTVPKGSKFYSEILNLLEPSPLVHFVAFVLLIFFCIIFQKKEILKLKQNFKEERVLWEMIEEKIEGEIIHGKRVDDGIGFKNTLITAVAILLLGVVAFFVTILIYNHNLEKTYSELDSTQIGETKVEDKSVQNTETASSQIGKTVEELENETQIDNEENKDVIQGVIEQNEQTVGKTENKPQETVRKENEEPKEENKKNQENEQVKDPEFEVPVEGEIIKEFAQDKLVYSETLKEWVVHTGIDIKAEKTTVVKAAEGGKVTAIKNDPRYGITVIIEHANGFETRYANLLTAEFVTVGEEVTKGQTIGTVGNTATFEVLDECHLHFEILKNGEYQNPIFFMDI